MNSELKEKILYWLEDKYKIDIIYACEWGSRAHGVERKDSDFNLRFVFLPIYPDGYADFFIDYLNEREELSVNKLRPTEPKDTYQSKSSKTWSIDGDESQFIRFDYEGWDIAKAIKKLYKLNPTMIEVVYSPVVYRNSSSFDFAGKAKRLIEMQANHDTLLLHYKCLAKKYWHEIKSEKDKVRVKDYMALVRCSIMIEWIVAHRSGFSDGKKYIELNLANAIEDLLKVDNEEKVVDLSESYFIDDDVDLNVAFDESFNRSSSLLVEEEKSTKSSESKRQPNEKRALPLISWNDVIRAKQKPRSSKDRTPRIKELDDYMSHSLLPFLKNIRITDETGGHSFPMKLFIRYLCSCIRTKYRGKLDWFDDMLRRNVTIPVPQLNTDYYK